MRSLAHKPSNRRQMYLALANKIEGQLRDAYAKRNEAGLDTQASLAEKLGVGRSVIHRRLSGRQNMTLETLADMAWVLNQCIAVEIFDPAENPSNEPRVIPMAPVTLTGTSGNPRALLATSKVISTSFNQ